MKTRMMVAAGAAILFLVGGVWLIASPQSPSDQSVRPSTPLPQAPRSSLSAAAKPHTVTPAIGLPIATPAIITVNTSTTVTITVQISPAPLAGGVNLLRVGAPGSQPTILGAMHDDGLNGDAVAGDGIWTLQVNFNEPSAGQIQLQVSAAFEKMLKRVTSDIAIVSVWPQLASTSLGVTANYPPNWSILASTDADTVIFSSTGHQPVKEGDLGEDIFLIVDANPSALTPDQWVKENFGIDTTSLAPSVLKRGVLSDGTPYLELLGVLPSSDPDTGEILISKSGKLVTLRTSPLSVFGPQFDMILHTLEVR